jgi:hypothetical protein
LKNYLLNLSQGPSFLDVDVSSFAFASNERIGSFEMSAESVVGIDNSQAA